METIEFEDISYYDPLGKSKVPKVVDTKIDLSSDSSELE